MPKYIKHYIQQKTIQNFNEKKNRKLLMIKFLKMKKKKKFILKTKISFARVKSRCIVSGRAKGFYSQFKLARHAIKKLFTMGKMPGIILSSW